MDGRLRNGGRGEAGGGPSVVSFRLGPSDGIPNNSRLPVLVYKSALGETRTGPVKERLEANGWTGTWNWRVYDFHHFHPASHEVLVCTTGWATLQIGGPDGRPIRIVPGDALVLPAGTGHCQREAGGGFEVCGAYPPGQRNPAIVRAGEMDAAAAERAIAATPLPRTDPISGVAGPLLEAWR